MMHRDLRILFACLALLFVAEAWFSVWLVSNLCSQDCKAVMEDRR
jgi:membrane-anchored protein YejM (alkaline phosphatase superfamily)